MSRSSGFSSAAAVTVRRLPGPCRRSGTPRPSRTISGCMGHFHCVFVAASGISGSSAMPHLDTPRAVPAYLGIHGTDVCRADSRLLSGRAVLAVEMVSGRRASHRRVAEYFRESALTFLLHSPASRSNTSCRCRERFPLPSRDRCSCRRPASSDYGQINFAPARRRSAPRSSSRRAYRLARNRHFGIAAELVRRIPASRKVIEPALELGQTLHSPDRRSCRRRDLCLFS